MSCHRCMQELSFLFGANPATPATAEKPLPTAQPGHQLCYGPPRHTVRSAWAPDVSIGAGSAVTEDELNVWPTVTSHAAHYGLMLSASHLHGHHFSCSAGLAACPCSQTGGEPRLTHVDASGKAAMVDVGQACAHALTLLMMPSTPAVSPVCKLVENIRTLRIRAHGGQT